MINDCGVYRIVHIASGKIYIGSSKYVDKRLLGHRRDLNQGRHCNFYLQRTWNKYGANAFLFEPLIKCGLEERRQREAEILDEHVARGVAVFNLSRIDRSSVFEDSLELCERRKAAANTPECKAKKSERMKGNKITLGYRHTEATLAKISAASKGNQYALGQKLTPETRAKMSVAQKGNQRGLGYKHTNEARFKISATTKQSWLSSEYRSNQSERMKGNSSARGYKHSEEHKAKMRSLMKGRIVSVTTREKMSVAIKLALANRRKLLEEHAKQTTGRQIS